MRQHTTKTILLSALLTTSLMAQGEFETTVYNHGESKPIAKNDRPQGGMRKNRRVDVHLNTTVTEAHMQSKEVTLEDGSMIWTTTDPLVSTAQLDIKAPTLYLGENKGVKFYTYNNYHDYIARYELLVVYKDDKGHIAPIKLFEGKGLEKEIQWDINQAALKLFNPKHSLLYILRVYDKEGNYDETQPKRLLVKSGKQPKGFQDIAGEIFGKSAIKTQTIPLHGTRVRVHGIGLNPKSFLRIEDQEVRVDSSGKFVYESVKHAGTYQLPLSIMTPQGQILERDLNLDVEENHLFMVGIADVTAGQNHISGNINPLSADEVYDEDIFVNGRMAFYLKGKIKGKYLITAQMDTKEGELKSMFKNLSKKDAKTMFRHLDPDRYYYVYGDDSHSYKDTDSQGKFYLRVDWDKSKALWGNYNTSITGNEFANINRSLYGAKIQHSSLGVTRYGDNKSDLTLFASEAQSAYAHNEFEGTGGSLYYLKHKDILQGSEKIWVEVRERNSQRVSKKIILQRGSDYEIDEIQGRIILKRPLSPRSHQAGPSIIKDKPLDGNRLYLKVDYEYQPDQFQANKGTYGARGKQWIGDSVAVGMTYGHEGREGEDYEVVGTDVTIKAGNNTYIKAEVASSDALQAKGNHFSSDDGGLRFDAIERKNRDKSSGKAYGVEAKASLSDFTQTNHESSASLWYKKREDGFSNARLGSADSIEDYGVEATSQLGEHLNLTARGTVLKEETHKERTASVQMDANMGDITVGIELRKYQEQLHNITSADATLLGAKVRYALSEYYALYALAQNTLKNRGNYHDNDLYTLGAEARYGDLTLDAEASTGDRGQSITLGMDYGINQYYNIYTNYTLSTDSTEGGENRLTFGQKSQISDALSVFSEHQFSHSDALAGLGNIFGIDYAFSKVMTANVTYNQSHYDDLTQRDRDALSLSLNYQDKDLTASTKLEYRKDKNPNAKERQYLTANRINYRVDSEWRLMAKLNYAQTKTDNDAIQKATFTEAGVGFAYRPISDAHFNLIGKYTYLYDLSSLAQSPQSNDEKSHILSADMSYALSSKWTLGSKLGAKHYALRAQRNQGTWHKSQLYLAALRANYHLIKSWDGMLEAHALYQKDDGFKKGLLAGVYRHIGEFAKLGVGYNFTDFSDDLNHINDYDARGWFINVIGKY